MGFGIGPTPKRWFRSYTKLNMYFYFQTVQLIDKTDADVKIFAGDVNALPFPGIINGKRQPYSLLTSILTDSLVDRYVLFLSFHISLFC